MPYDSRETVGWAQTSMSSDWGELERGPRVDLRRVRNGAKRGVAGRSRGGRFVFPGRVPLFRMGCADLRYGMTTLLARV